MKISMYQASIPVLKRMLGNLKAEFLPPVEVKGLPTAQNLQSIDALAETVATKHQGL
mgnify:CR=1 FL=1